MGFVEKGKKCDAFISKVQSAIDGVTEWGFDWGCRFSVEKTQTVFFTRKIIEDGMKLRMYGKELDHLNIGVIFDSIGRPY